MIAQAAAADVLRLVPRGEGELEQGSAVSYLPLLARRRSVVERRCDRTTRRIDRTIDRIGPLGRSRASGYGVAPCGPRRELGPMAAAARTIRTDALDVADRDQDDQVPGRVQSEAEPQPEREQHEQRPDESCGIEREPYRKLRGANLRQPQPEREGRKGGRGGRRGSWR